jgi:hypothetical protein
MSDDLQPPPETLEQQAHRLRIQQVLLDQKILQAQDRLDRLNREQQTLQFEINKVRRLILETRNKKELL